RVPIVVGAVIYDLGLGRSEIRPGPEEGAAAFHAAAERNHACGSIGAGTGATVAKLGGRDAALKGGLGTASERLAGGITVGALAVVNAVGEVVRPEDGVVLAGPRAEGGGFRDTLSVLRAGRERGVPVMTNTTIAVVATDAALH